MKVGINARLLSSPAMRGWNRYTVNLLRELAGLGVELVLYSDRPLSPDHLDQRFEVRVAPPMKYILWEQSWLPRQCAHDGVEVLHALCNFGLPWWSHCARVLTLHDAIGYTDEASCASWRERLTPASVKSHLYNWIARTRADQVITVSEHAKSELIQYLGIQPDRITVIYEDAAPQFHRVVSSEEQERVRTELDLDRTYVLYLGGWEARKNVAFLVQAFAVAAVPAVDLVLAGGDAEGRIAMTRIARENGIGDRVKLLGRVDENLLPGLYAGALAFVYPSRHEGFGLQACEAMAVGCPTLVANATSLPEVVGYGGEVFSLNDPEDLAALLRRVTEDRPYRDDLTRRARIRSAHFSWRRAAEQTLEVYRRAACLPSILATRSG